MTRNCPLCETDNSSGAASLCSSGPWRVRDCARCGFVYLENPPDYEQYKTEWAWEKTCVQEGQRRLAAEPVLQRIANLTKWIRRRLLKRKKLARLIRSYLVRGAVLDLGCGKGNALRRLGEMGFVPSGVEVSDALAARASQQAAAFGGSVVLNNALDGLDQFPDRAFTGATLLSFLEHESNPLALLTKLSRKLAANGRIIVKVPNFGCWNRRIRGARWCGFRFPDHVNYFTPGTLRALIQLARFKVIRFRPLDRFPLSDSMWMVGQTAGTANESIDPLQ